MSLVFRVHPVFLALIGLLDAISLIVLFSNLGLVEKILIFLLCIFLHTTFCFFEYWRLKLEDEEKEVKMYG
jgi:positive regulator of sigma E activity